LETGSNRGDLPDFEQPPVAEVAAGLFFPRIQQFLVPHFGQFWDRVRSDFPHVEHAAPLASQSSIQRPAELMDPTGTILPRVWLISRTGQALLQLQPDTFFYNWRRQNENDEYPHYGLVLRQFWKYYTAFLEFLGEFNIESSSPSELELTYVNHITKDDLWNSYSDISNIFKDLNWKDPTGRFLPEPFAHSHVLNFRIPAHPAVLRLTIQSAVRLDSQVQIIRLDMSVRYNLATSPESDRHQIEEAFEVAHQWIVRGFADITAENAQKNKWRRK
jgi:uncharacterized protein (TIGR04255 family)